MAYTSIQLNDRMSRIEAALDRFITSVELAANEQRKALEAERLARLKLYDQERRERIQSYEQERLTREAALEAHDKKLTAWHDKFMSELVAERDARTAHLEAERVAREEALEAERVAREEALETERVAREEALEAERVAREEALEAERKKNAREWNKQWGDIANRLGRVVEYIAAPNVQRIARERFNYTDVPDVVAVRYQVKHPTVKGKNREFDTLVVYPDVVFFNETKETVRQRDLEQFSAFIKSDEFFEFFPNYKDRKLIPIFSSLYLADSVVNYLTKQKIYAMGMGDETMELLNFAQLNFDDF